MSSRDNLATDDAGVTRWDRARWISVFSSHNPTIREVTECLGLGLSASSSTTNRGIPKFDNPDYRKLSSEVTRLSKELPKERDALLDFAADARSLERELDELLAAFGPAIWGRDTDRSCLLTPDPAKKTYRKDLFYEDPDDRQILKIHLHRWIIIKACYYIRNMKLKRPSAAADYDSLADLEADGEAMSPVKPHLSPNGTPQSATPPAEGSSTTAGAESSARPVAGKKRKSSVYMSVSDGEDMGSTPAKRAYQSHTMPVQRKSPRKSLKSLASDSPISENIPPTPSQTQSHSSNPQPSMASVSGPEPARPLLTPLTSNDLNGEARPASTAPPAGGFTAVNTNSFTALNTAPPMREVSSHTPSAPNARNYSSPYDSSPYGAPTSQNPSKALKGPPVNTASIVTHGFQAINSPTVTNGTSARNSPIVQHNTHAQIPALAQGPAQSQHQPQPQPQLQPASRSNTPIARHASRASVAHHPSRSNTPIAPAANIQPALAATVHATAAPPVQNPPPTNVQQVPVSHVPYTIPPNIHYVPQAHAVLKSHPVEPSTMPLTAPSAADTSLLQCEVLGHLMQYLFPKPSSPPDETALLHKLESLWHLNAAIFSKQIGPLYDLQSKVLLSWITERRKITQLRHSLAYAPGVPAAEMVDRLLAINDLRVMRLKWKNMSSAEGLSAEDLLCRTLAVVTNTEGTEYLFKDGLDRLNDGLFEFLRSEDMRILMHKR